MARELLSTTVPKAIWKRIIRRPAITEPGANRTASAGEDRTLRSGFDELQIRLEEQNEVVAEAIEARKRTRLVRKLPNWKWTS